MTLPDTPVVYFLRENRVLDKVKEWKAWTELESERKLKIIWSDIGGEFTSAHFEQFLGAGGVQHQKTAPYTPQQNGVIERANRTHVERARSMLSQAEMPKSFWSRGCFGLYLQSISDKGSQAPDSIRGLPLQEALPPQSLCLRMCHIRLGS
jgi:transposase InsO family protein